MNPRKLLLVLVTTSTSSIAQPTASESAAELLFREGRQLLLDDNPKEACPKLAESLRIGSGDGTRLLLAQCYERVGKVASAWRLYVEVVGNGPKHNNADYLRAAASKIDKLTPRLPRIALVVPAKTAALEGFEVSLDGVKLGPETFGAPIPIDPGVHVILASARDHKSVTVEITAKTPGELISVPLPDLTLLPAPLPPASSTPVAVVAPVVSAEPSADAPPAPEPKRPRAWQPVAGYAAAGAGAVGLLVGAYFLRQSLQQNDEANGRCAGVNCPDPGAVRLSKDAVRSGNLATLLLGGGLALVGAGTTLILTAPPAPPSARPGLGGMIAWSGRF